MDILGIDIGGSSLKAAPVNLASGECSAAEHQIATPQSSTPQAVAEAVAELSRHFTWRGPIGCTFPAVVKHGVTLTAANVDKSWVGCNGERLFAEHTGCPVVLLNDADAAGIAEMQLGAGCGRDGVVIMLTLGTGIGSAIFVDGTLVPNTEFGHLEIRGKDAEHRAAARVRKEKDLSWEAWSARLNEFLSHMERLFSPDLFIIGGGISQRHERFFPLLRTRAELLPARFYNQAGIIGAALAAGRRYPPAGAPRA